MITFFVPTTGNWSGGGSAVLDNFRFAAAHHPQISFERGDVAIINRNFSRTRLSLPQILIPQNAWAWHGPHCGVKERSKVLGLRAVSELAMRRSLGVVRVSSALPARGKTHELFLPNPLDQGFDLALSHAPSSAPVSGRYFVSIGSLHGYRGVETLVTAHREFWKAGGRLPLHIVGGGSPAYVEKIQRITADLEGVVLHDGALSRAECIRWLRHATAAVLPSHVEASPISLLEALAVQPNVIASDIPGHREIVPASTSGPTWFQHRRPGDLTIALRSAADRPAVRLTHRLADPDFRAGERQRWAGRLLKILNDLASS